jgi:orotate phosphoribosyltransferase
LVYAHDSKSCLARDGSSTLPSGTEFHLAIIYSIVALGGPLIGETMNIRQAIVGTGGVLEGEYFFALKKKPNVSVKYINVDPVFTYPQLVFNLGFALTRMWEGDDFEVMAGPAVGGIPLVFAAAHPWGTVRTVWADKQEDGSFAFERMGFAEAIRGKRVLVVEDVTLTGSSTKAVCDLTKDAGGQVVGASVVWNRGNVTAESIGVPHMRSLVKESVETWEAEEHTMWGTWPLVEDIGHPDHFPDYPGPRIKLLSP